MKRMERMECALKLCENKVKKRSNVYCSPACAGAAKRGLDEVVGTVERVCLVCPNGFIVTTRNSSQKYCSRSCAVSVNNIGVSRTARPRAKCIACDNKSAQHSVYCSMDCKRRHKIDRWLSGVEIPKLITASSKTFRPHILAEQGGKCALCPVTTVWNDLPIVLILDHIDGNSNNNVRDNLRLVCPNCDSQLPTYKAKNRGNGRHFRRTRYAEGKSF